MKKEDQKKVVVLMSTYNGEDFIENQLDSILNQRNVNVQIIIRDDGSRDRTPKILGRYSNYKNIKVVFGKNIGWKRSFFWLLQNVNAEKDTLFSFADQDDVWLPDKLFCAANHLKDSVPMAYHSNVTIVDEQLNVLGNRFKPDFEPNLQFPEFFFDSVALGCTMVFNSTLLKIVKQHIPDEPTQHDAYVYVLAYLFGQCFYDSDSHILYRRHTSATSGFGKVKDASRPTLIDRYKKYKKGPKNQFSIRAQQLLNGYSSQLRLKDLRFLKLVANYRENLMNKLLLLCSQESHASGMRKTLQIKYRILANTL